METATNLVGYLLVEGQVLAGTSCKRSEKWKVECSPVQSETEWWIALKQIIYASKQLLKLLFTNHQINTKFLFIDRPKSESRIVKHNLELI